MGRQLGGLILAALAGCASMSRPEYCKPLESQWQQKIAALSDWDVAWMVTAMTQARYQGSCPCPDSTDRAGNRCGARSAYSRGGGIRLACTPDDVDQSAILPARAHLALAALPSECGGMNLGPAMDWAPSGRPLR